MPCRSSIPGRVFCRRRNSSRWCIAPTQRIIAEVRRQVPGAKVIGFPRGVGTGAAALRGRGSGRCRRARLDGRSRLRARSGAEARCRCRAISIRWCWSPAAPRSTARSTASSRRSPAAVHLQSRPRHPAGDADRACRADARARARDAGLTVPEGGTRWLRAAVAIAITAALVGLLVLWRPSGLYPWLKACTSSRSSPGWRECSICRGCSSITARPSRAPGSPRPSR